MYMMYYYPSDDFSDEEDWFDDDYYFDRYNLYENYPNNVHYNTQYELINYWGERIGYYKEPCKETK